jgi:hypothetical protein
LAYGLLKLYSLGMRADVEVFSSPSTMQKDFWQSNSKSETTRRHFGKKLEGRDLEFWYAADAELNAAESEGPDAPNASN